MTGTEEIVRRLEQKHREVIDALYADDTPRFKELFAEEGKLIDELHELVLGDVTLSVDEPYGSRNGRS